MRKWMVLILLTFLMFSCAYEHRVTPLPDNRYELSVKRGDLAADPSYNKWLAEKAKELCPGYKVLSSDEKWSPFDTTGAATKARTWVIECPAIKIEDKK